MKVTTKRFENKKTFAGRSVKKMSVDTRYARPKRQGKKMRPMRQARKRGSY